MPNCIELNNCPIQAPFDMFTYPFRLFFGDFFFILVWGIILSVIYLRTHNAMLTSLVGIIIGSFFAGSTAIQGSTIGQSFNIGYILVAVSIGIAMFSLIRSKANNP